MSDPIFVSTIDDSPGEITITLKTKSGVDTIILEKQLSLYEMQQMHVKLTAALYYRMMDNADRFLGAR